jgi:hypothetical protein
LGYTSSTYNITVNLQCGASLADPQSQIVVQDTNGHFLIDAASFVKVSNSRPLMLSADSPSDLFGAGLIQNVFRLCQVNNFTINTNRCMAKSTFSSRLIWTTYQPNNHQFAWFLLSPSAARANGVLPGYPNSTSGYFLANINTNPIVMSMAQSPLNSASGGLSVTVAWSFYSRALFVLSEVSSSSDAVCAPGFFQVRKNVCSI